MSGHTRTAAIFPVSGHPIGCVLKGVNRIATTNGTSIRDKTTAPPKRDPSARNLYCLRREKPSPARLMPSSASVAGSGTDSVTENAVVSPPNEIVLAPDCVPVS
jgi:hypothetical protein